MTSNDSAGPAPQNVEAKRKRGAPLGNRNRYKTGLYTREAKALRREIAAWKRTTRALLEWVETTNSGASSTPPSYHHGRT